MGSFRGTGRIDPQVKRHVDDLYEPLSAVLEAAEAAQALRDHPGWNHVQAMIDAEIALVMRGLNSGGEPFTQAEYAKAHGRLGGLGFAREALDAIVQRADQRYAEQTRKHEGAAEPVPEGATA